uniref:Uncharacterized protein n=1 Tax=Pseudo-nitzschia delicatissima TaxID=44447 RepID=A0A7S0XK76_9STRA|mmetsp:Transcript_195/g.458  ORF Transcript_195/g.458 Transcript_195/m.458 type:complete len:592 (+) Transcript_195:201-1976(+)|eukprot:CAMPEP_0116103738 /NCGR_PEP_ID=MMETSP0327-20121206/14047_1 /TAXON_ID=44447 /ORGANISM="Pseudo-nitzschia delicatissima, Strain B596" /LENGTH=591 /DNA_ID=CAMNT_0003595873 /DNA_START=154 /DNA_END=1929 /DNA_ORIENTATION=-
MATPVSVEAPPHAHIRTGSEQERFLQEKVQRMISLQYQEQKLSNDEYDGDSSSRKNNEGGGLMMSKRKSGKTTANLMDLEAPEVKQGSDKPPHPSSDDMKVTMERPDLYPDVGKGTIVFSGDLRGSKYSTHSVENQQQQQYPPPKSPVMNQQRGQHKQELSPHSTTLGKQQQQNLLSSTLPQQLYSDYGAVQEQHHEFHYGNPDYQMDDQDYYYDGDEQRRNQRGKRSLLTRLSECVYQPVVSLLSQENLHRSFCYGAIDGLLTGSGIASAFWGLGLLSIRTPVELRMAVVAFTMAACFADSVCMAMGHVWTTYIVTSNHAWERSYERQLLERDKADSKGKLVDMLLDRGMLKIDAMSLADTLEGYPDLFVSALVGDSLLSSGIQDAVLDEPSESEFSEQYSRSPVYSDPATDFDGTGGFLGSFASWTFPLHYSSERNVHRDVEYGHVRVVSRESQKEGMFMLIGFACFAAIPSLLWVILPLWFDADLTSMSGRYAVVDDGESVNVPSLIILVLSAIIWCLGVWKSQFVDSNWVVFGLETVAVLIICISSAYGVAAILMYCLGTSASANGEMTILDKWNLATNPAAADSGL